jgi:hypothetical protein
LLLRTAQRQFFRALVIRDARCVPSATMADTEAAAEAAPMAVDPAAGAEASGSGAAGKKRFEARVLFVFLSRRALRAFAGVPAAADARCAASLTRRCRR